METIMMQAPRFIKGQVVWVNIDKSITAQRLNEELNVLAAKSRPYVIVNVPTMRNNDLLYLALPVYTLHSGTYDEEFISRNVLFKDNNGRPCRIDISQLHAILQEQIEIRHVGKNPAEPFEFITYMVGNEILTEIGVKLSNRLGLEEFTYAKFETKIYSLIAELRGYAEQVVTLSENTQRAREIWRKDTIRRLLDAGYSIIGPNGAACTDVHALMFILNTTPDDQKVCEEAGISHRTLRQIDRAVLELDNGYVSPPINLHEGKTSATTLQEKAEKFLGRKLSMPSRTGSGARLQWGHDLQTRKDFLDLFDPENGGLDRKEIMELYGIDSQTSFYSIRNQSKKVLGL